MTLARRKFSGPGRRSTWDDSLFVEIIPPPMSSPKPQVVLKKRGLYHRSDHLNQLREMSLGFQRGAGPSYSQAEIIRAAVDYFLDLPESEIKHQLQRNREREAALGVGPGSVRPPSS